jgi:hypothetical protein
MVGFAKLSIALTLLGDATLLIHKSCEPTELQFLERRARVWGGYIAALPVLDEGLVELQQSPMPSGCCQGWLTCVESVNSTAGL